MINRIVNEINACLANDLHLAALGLALTLPDTCGKAEFPNKKTRDRYIEWFDKYIGQYEQKRQEYTEEELADLPFLSGELVYQLRCSFLHSNDIDIDINRLTDEQNKLSVFNLVLRRHDDILASGTSSYINYDKDGIIKYRRYDVSVTYLCQILSNVARDYYEKNKEKFDFFTYNIIDKTTLEASKGIEELEDN